MKNHTRRVIIALITLIVLAREGQAQERPIYTQYMFNETTFNPAYAGSSERLSATALYRKQWVGVEGAPSTQALSVHAPINKSSIALGLQVLNDKIGVSSRTELQSMFAYRIRFNDKSKLSMGIQTGVRWNNEGYSQLYDATGDVQFSESLQQARFLVGTGVYYHTDRFYLGASVPVIRTAQGVGNHYFITSGYVFDMGEHLKVKPNVLLKLADNAPASYDLNTTLLIHEIVWFGVSYRSSESVGLLTRLQITEELSFGYAFDLPVSGISPYGSGSHEMMLNYRIRIPSTSYQSPRYF